MEGEWKIVPSFGCVGKRGTISAVMIFAMVSAASKQGLEQK